jgi:hypothetical protein
MRVKMIRDGDGSWDFHLGYQEWEEWLDAAAWNSFLSDRTSPSKILLLAVIWHGSKDTELI